VKLLVATSNAGKLGELRELLAPVGFELVSLEEAGLEAPEETGVFFHDNAEIKARESAVKAGLWALGDDSGLCVDALNGEPGVRSARYAPTDVERRHKLLEALKSLPINRRGAHFFCAVALCAPDGQRLFRAEGRVDGEIAMAARGSNGFGYDPIFEPAETPGRTLAELSSAEKNRLSHRGRALERLRPLLQQLARDGTL
jgi:XTP/dITP diphosphohydrolase